MCTGTAVEVTCCEAETEPPDNKENIVARKYVVPAASRVEGQANVEEQTGEMVNFQKIRFYYANVIDYGRFFLCCLATFGVCGTLNYPWVTAFLLYASFILDMYDGKVARYFNQCSLMGDGLDWACDLFVDLLFTLWWGKFEPALMPWLLIVYVLEVAAALFDFSIHSSTRYPPRGVQTGFCVILQWMSPHNKWTDFGWFAWLSYPPFVLARCLWLQGCAFPWLLLAVQVALFVPGLCYLWWNVALLFGNLGRWTELDQNRKRKMAH